VLENDGERPLRVRLQTRRDVATGHGRVERAARVDIAHVTTARVVYEHSNAVEYLRYRGHCGLSRGFVRNAEQVVLFYVVRHVHEISDRDLLSCEVYRNKLNLKIDYSEKKTKTNLISFSTI
jgi:hypothetical protein